MTEFPDEDPDAAIGEHDPFAGDRRIATLSWTVHPARRQPWSVAFLVAGLLTAGAGVHEVTGNKWYGVAAAAVLGVLFRGFLLPTTYTLDDAGAEARGPFGSHTRSWAEARRFRHDPAGGTLETAAAPGVWNALTGLRLAWSHNRREAVRFALDRLPPGCRVTADAE